MTKTMDFNHVSVMLEQCIEALDIHPDKVYVDGTAGGAGHSVEIAKKLASGCLYSFDKDPDAVAAAKERLSPYPQAHVIHDDFSNIAPVLEDLDIQGIDGLLLDLGVSSHQLDKPERGFSFHQNAPLDMRMSQEGLTAGELVNTWPRKELERILFAYGEEPNARRIAAAIIRQREAQPIETTHQLAEIIRSAVPARVRREHHPARKSFQAIRIAVNRELDLLGQALEDAFSILRPGGRIAVITFHSLEDRIVKQTFNAWCKGCICPPDFPVCVCGKKPRARLVYRKPLIPSQEEQTSNRRSRSAKLRVAEKIE